ncbi:MAG TPA: TetR/AcrR family transcriptional regulator [Pyrinomonadaceae bacterium]|nr:TetR/AcrR family transcriptional regulator [Pyrinomonadaceae bacterium]
MSVSTAAVSGESSARPDEYRDRLLEGMAAALGEKGFAEVTIADIARHARVSRRTFYEHFDTKQDCLLALYVASSERALARIADSIDPSLDLDAQIAKTTEVYFSSLQERPGVLRTLLVEILAAGPRGLEVRRQINRRYADLLRKVIASAKPNERERHTLSSAMAMAVVGGLNELMLQAVEDGGDMTRLRRLARPAAELVRSVVGR